MSRQNLKPRVLADAETGALDAAGVPVAARRGLRIIEMLRLYLQRRRAKAMLRSALGAARHEDSRNLPSYLLRDIGLQPPL